MRVILKRDLAGSNFYLPAGVPVTLPEGVKAPKDAKKLPDLPAESVVETLNEPTEEEVKKFMDAQEALKADQDKVIDAEKEVAKEKEELAQAQKELADAQLALAEDQKSLAESLKKAEGAVPKEKGATATATATPSAKVK